MFVLHVEYKQDYPLSNVTSFRFEIIGKLMEIGEKCEGG